MENCHKHHKEQERGEYEPVETWTKEVNILQWS